MKNKEFDLEIGNFRIEIVKGKKVGMVDVNAKGIDEFHYTENDTLFLVSKDKTKAIAWKRPKIILDPEEIKNYIENGPQSKKA